MINQIQVADYFSSAECVIVAVSGGPDSMCLLNLLTQAQSKKKFKLIVVHLNYGLRGSDSNQDQKLVERFCKHYGLPCEVKKVKGLSLESSNLEEKLRKMRYDFLETVRKKYRADKIALAHTFDDQAETVLMRILRGSGLRGLRGMCQKSEIRNQNSEIIRPLLGFTHEKVLAYCKKYKVPYRIDQSNFNPQFFRNRVRHQILPYLEKFNPDLKLNLVRLAVLAKRDYQFIAEIAQKELKKMILRQTSQMLELDYQKWLQLAPALQYEVLRQAILLRKGSLEEIKLVHLDQVVLMLRKGVGKKHKVLPGGLKIELLNAKIKLQ